jgi:hypothetical protein
LSKFFYDDGDGWPKLRKANPDKSLDPGDIVMIPGQKFRTDG